MTLTFALGQWGLTIGRLKYINVALKTTRGDILITHDKCSDAVPVSHTVPHKYGTIICLSLSGGM
jgi:hypothetical protein